MLRDDSSRITDFNQSSATIKDVYSLNIDEDLKDSSMKGEIAASSKLRYFLEKICNDLELSMIGNKDEKLTNIKSRILYFEDQFAKLDKHLETQYEHQEIRANEVYMKQQDLEAKVSILEKDIKNQLTINNRLGEELILYKDQVEKDRETLHDRYSESPMNKEGEEKLEKDLTELRIKYRNLQKDHIDVESEFNSKCLEVASLKSELKEMTERMEELIHINDEQESDQQLKTELLVGLRASIRNSKNILQRIPEERMSDGSTKSEYKDKLTDLIEQLDKERDFIANLQIEVAGLRSKNEEYEDRLLQAGMQGEGMQRLDSNLLKSSGDFDLDDFPQESALLSHEFGKVTQIRKIREHKAIQVGLDIQGIKEVDEEYIVEKILTSIEIKKIDGEIDLVTLSYEDDEGTKSKDSYRPNASHNVSFIVTSQGTEQNGVDNEILGQLESQILGMKDKEEEILKQLEEARVKLQEQINGLSEKEAKEKTIEKLESIQKKLILAQAQNGKLRAAVKQLEANSQDVDISSVILKNQILSDKIKETESKAEEKEIEITALKQSYKDKLTSLKDTIEELKSENLSLKSDKEMLGEKLYLLEEAIESLKSNSSEEINNLLLELERKKEESKQQKADAFKQPSETKTSPRSPLDTQKLESVEIIKSHPQIEKVETIEIASELQSDIDRLRHKNEYLESSLAASAKQISELRKQLNSVSQLNKEISKETGSCSHDLEALRDKISVYEEKLNELKQENKELHEKNTELSECITSTSESLSSIKIEKESLASKARALESEIEKLKISFKEQKQGLLSRLEEQEELINKIRESHLEDVDKLKAELELKHEQEEQERPQEMPVVNPSKKQDMIGKLNQMIVPINVKNDDAPKKRLIKRDIEENENSNLQDYVNLLKNPSVIKILIPPKSGLLLKDITIFSDYITRINSKCERKIRVLMITENHLYILTKSKTTYKIKYVIQLSLITRITFPTKNSTLIKISFQNQYLNFLSFRADQMVESFRRNSLVLYLREVCRKKGNKIKVLKTDSISFVNRHRKKKDLNLQVDEMFRPEFQEALTLADMVLTSSNSRKGLLRLLGLG